MKFHRSRKWRTRWCTGRLLTTNSKFDLSARSSILDTDIMHMRITADSGINGTTIETPRDTGNSGEEPNYYWVIGLIIFLLLCMCGNHRGRKGNNRGPAAPPPRPTALTPPPPQPEIIHRTENNEVSPDTTRTENNEHSHSSVQEEVPSALSGPPPQYDDITRSFNMPPPSYDEVMKKLWTQCCGTDDYCVQNLLGNLKVAGSDEPSVFDGKVGVVFETPVQRAVPFPHREYLYDTLLCDT